MDDRSPIGERRDGAAAPSDGPPEAGAVGPLDDGSALSPAADPGDPVAGGSGQVVAVYFLGFAVASTALAVAFTVTDHEPIGGLPFYLFACVAACCAAVFGLFTVAVSGGKRGGVTLLLALLIAAITALVCRSTLSGPSIAGMH